MATKTEKIRIKLQTDGANRSERKIRGVQSATAALAKGMAVAATAGIAMKKALDFAKLAGKVDALRRSHESLAKAQGLNADVMINKMDKATRGTVKQMDLLQQANNALLLGLPVTEKDMGMLASAGRRLGKAMGVDAAMGLESLVVGIGRQSKLWLDNLGIIVDTNKAYEVHANKLDKQVSALTDAEKKLAFYNATMESVRIKMGQLPEDVDDVTDAVARAEVAWENLATTIGQKAAPSISNLFETITGFITGEAKSAWDDFVSGAGFKEWAAAAVLAVDQTNVWAASVIGAMDKVKTPFVGPSLPEGYTPEGFLKTTKKVSNTQARILNIQKETLKARGAESVEMAKVLTFTERHKKLMDKIPVGMKNQISLQKTWTSEAHNTLSTMQSIYQVMIALQGAQDLRKKSGMGLFKGLLSLGGAIAMAIPGGQAIGYGLLAGSAGLGALGAQHGMDTTVDKPTLILAGEGNQKEKVKITPQPAPKDEAGKTAIFNFYGDVYDPDSFAELLGERSKLGFNDIQVKSA